MTTSLESRNFVATIADITALATAYNEALDSQSERRGTYLKALVGTTQAELGVAPRQRGARAKTISDEERKAHLAALEAVHERFYKAVQDALELEVSPQKERHRRGIFARTAVSTLRAWIRNGGDIRALAASKVTKAALRVDVKPARQRVVTPAARADRLANRVLAAAQELALQDTQAAVELLEATITRLAAQLVALGAPPTTKLEQAVKQHKPFRTKEGDVFWPATVEPASMTIQ